MLSKTWTDTNNIATVKLKFLRIICPINQKFTKSCFNRQNTRADLHNMRILGLWGYFLVISKLYITSDHTYEYIG